MSFDREKISFIKALDALIEYHNLVRPIMTTAPVTKTPNKFVSFLEHVGHDFKIGLEKVLPFAETAGEVAVKIIAPGASTLFNQTVAAVVTAEQNAVALGQQSGTGPQKLASVVTLMGALISQSLVDAGKPADTAAVQKYISAVVTILNAMPAPAQTAPALPAAPAQITSNGPTPTIAAPTESASTATSTGPSAFSSIAG